MTATREQKEQMLLKVIQVKGFEDEDTLWFARMMETTDNLEHLTWCKEVALMTFEEKVKKFASI